MPSVSTLTKLKPPQLISTYASLMESVGDLFNPFLSPSLPNLPHPTLGEDLPANSVLGPSVSRRSPGLCHLLPSPGCTRLSCDENHHGTADGQPCWPAMCSTKETACFGSSRGSIAGHSEKKPLGLGKDAFGHAASRIGELELWIPCIFSTQWGVCQ